MIEWIDAGKVAFDDAVAALDAAFGRRRHCVAVIDVAGFVADLKDHAVEHGFHVHDERHFVESYSLRQNWEVDLHPEEGCEGPLDLYLSLEIDPRVLLGFEDAVIARDDDRGPAGRVPLPAQLHLGAAAAAARPRTCSCSPPSSPACGGPDLPLEVSAIDSYPVGHRRARAQLRVVAHQRVSLLRHPPRRGGAVRDARPVPRGESLPARARGGLARVVGIPCVAPVRELDPVATEILGPVRGHVGVAEQVVHRRLLIVDRDADRKRRSLNRRPFQGNVFSLAPDCGLGHAMLLSRPLLCRTDPMAKKTEGPETTGNGKPGGEGGTPAAGQGAPQVAGAQLNVLGQYIKDLSFESPAAPEVLQTPPPNPQLQVTVNVNAVSKSDEAYEVVLNVEVHAKGDTGVIYNVELLYAGLFRLRGVPQNMLQPVLFIDCPAILFPFCAGCSPM